MTRMQRALTEQCHVESWVGHMLARCPDLLQIAADASVSFELLAERRVAGYGGRELRRVCRMHRTRLARVRRMADPIAKATLLLQEHYSHQQSITTTVAGAPFCNGNGTVEKGWSSATLAAEKKFGDFNAWVEGLAARCSTPAALRTDNVTPLRKSAA